MIAAAKMREILSPWGEVRKVAVRKRLDSIYERREGLQYLPGFDLLVERLDTLRAVIFGAVDKC